MRAAAIPAAKTSPTSRVVRMGFSAMGRHTSIQVVGGDDWSSSGPNPHGHPKTPLSGNSD
jgi:hypothetical protein